MKQSTIIKCPDCGERAFIKTTINVSDGFSNLYCICSNVECNASLVFSLYLSYHITPPRSAMSDDARKSLAVLPRSERRQIAYMLEK
ncbi:ogr/Delta-like zinc finger family protein [Buttiauxella gaviniae]|uniref:ogr/Delta-like zinc finger family protein n=1 Tax=Buttiauxella gaviniae TaxID=82990 RepID=UPI0007E36632|nr:ogr/Delta-like zinc finger family protein [Buttiauxella gaviniae]MRT15191.1 hypothetical protein [Enterobacteriaceae bacterium RIT711]